MSEVKGTVISLEFDGFWIEKSAPKIPEESGIYAVFEGNYEPSTNQVSLEKIIYIGTSDNVHDAVNNEESLAHWKTFRGNPDEEDDGFNEKGDLFFCFAPATGQERERGAAALIFEQKPPANDKKQTKDFAYEETSINLTGNRGLLTPIFTISSKE